MPLVQNSNPSGVPTRMRLAIKTKQTNPTRPSRNEVFREVPLIPGINLGKLEVSNFGRVRHSKRIRRPVRIGHHLYVDVAVTPTPEYGSARWRGRLDKLVLWVFSREKRPSEMEVVHTNGDPTDCRLDNLKLSDVKVSYGRAKERQGRKPGPRRRDNTDRYDALIRTIGLTGDGKGLSLKEIIQHAGLPVSVATHRNLLRDLVSMEKLEVIDDPMVLYADPDEIYTPDGKAAPGFFGGRPRSIYRIAGGKPPYAVQGNYYGEDDAIEDPDAKFTSEEIMASLEAVE